MNTPLAATQWETFLLPITVKSPGGVPIDLTNCQGIGCVLKGWKAVVRYPFTFTPDDDRTTGRLTVGLSDAQLGAMSYGSYLYQIKISDAAGRVLLLLSGPFLLRPGAPNNS